MSRLKKPPQAKEVYCPYCGAQAEWLPDSAIYSRSYGGTVYVCLPCKAWVGCHKGSSTPLGRLADAELRALKIEGHSLFDRIWRAAMTSRGMTQGYARLSAYRWLAEGLGITIDQCHFGKMDNATAHSAISFLRSYYSSIEAKRARQS